MAMIGVQKISNGMKVMYKDDVWSVVEFHHLKPGKGKAYVGMKLKSMTTGRVLEENFQASAKIEQTEVNYRRMSYLYMDGVDLVFMDQETFEQLPVAIEKLEGKEKFLTENMECVIVIWNENILGVDLPAKVEMKVVETYDAQRGDTATNITKEATLEGGYIAQVPLFIKTGDSIIVDTRDGSYESRAS